MEEGDRERLEAIIEAVTLAANAAQVREEIAELVTLAGQARRVEEDGGEAKLARLKDLLRHEGFFDRPEQRLLLFTEFKDTLSYLVDRLKGWGFRVGFVHGGMHPCSRPCGGRPWPARPSRPAPSSGRSSTRPRPASTSTYSTIGWTWT